MRYISLDKDLRSVAFTRKFSQNSEIVEKGVPLIVLHLSNMEILRIVVATHRMKESETSQLQHLLLLYETLQTSVYKFLVVLFRGAGLP